MPLSFRVTLSPKRYKAARVGILVGFMLILGVIIVSPRSRGAASSPGASGTESPQARLAQQTIRRYWYDIQHHNGTAGYAILSPRVQASTSLADFSQGWVQYVKQFSPLIVIVEKARVRGDRASVPITVHAGGAGVSHFYEHLMWSHGGWYITDKDGELGDAP